MAERIGIHGVDDETLDLLSALARRPDLEIVRIYTDRTRELLTRLHELDTQVAQLLVARLSERAEAVSGDPSLTAIVEGTPRLSPEFRARGASGAGPRVLSSAEARALWVETPDEPPPPAPEAVADPVRTLVDTLSGLLSAFETAGTGAAGFPKLLQLCAKALGAEGGSMMLLDPGDQVLRVRAALGLDPRLWPGVRVPLGAGVAGRVAAGESAVEIRGPVDSQRFPGSSPRNDRQAALCVPLRMGGKPLGVLNLHHTSQEGAFSPEALALAAQVGDLLAEVVERTQALERRGADARRFEVHRALQSILESGDGLHAQLTSICKLAATQAGGGIAQLYRLHGGGASLRLAATSLPTGAPARSDLLLPLGHGIEGEVARSREALRLQGEDGGWLWSLPLVTRGELAGVLSLQAGPSQRWEPEREGALRELAEGLSIALLRGDGEHAYARRESHFEQLADVSLRMLATRELGELLRLGTSEATRSLGADHAILRLLDPRTGRLAVRSYSGSAEGPLQEALFRMDRKLAGGLLETGASRRIEDVAGDPELSTHRESAHSAIATPLQEGNHLVGTLSVYDKLDTENLEPVSFETRDLDRLERFARHLEHALASVRRRARSGGQGLLDEETELPQQSFLERRVREELGRAHAAKNRFTLVSLRVENLDALRERAPIRPATDVVRRIADSLRSRIREFDVLARCAADEFGVLLPEPGSAPEERVLDLARAVTEDIRKPGRGDDARAQLAFGHASFPEDGSDWERLMTRAREARIRNL